MADKQKLCGALNGWHCTLDAGHAPPHVAHIGLGGPEVFRWNDGDPPPAPMVLDQPPDDVAKLRTRITALRAALIAVTLCRPHPGFLKEQLLAQTALDEDDYAAGRPRPKK